MRDIRRSEGSRGLFKGHSATLLRIFPYAAIKFLAYEQIRAVVITSREQETSFRRLISGSMAGITSVFFTYPLELIRVRLAFETKKTSRSSLTDAFRNIYNENVSRPSTATKPPGVSVSNAPVASAADAMSSTVNKAVPSSGWPTSTAGFHRRCSACFPTQECRSLRTTQWATGFAHPRLLTTRPFPAPKAKPRRGPDGLS